MSTTESTPQVSPIARIEALYQRLTRAKELVAQGKVSPVYGLPQYFFVEGQNTRYLVNGSCNCPDATYRTELLKGNCKHRLAALLYTEQSAMVKTPQATKPEPAQADTGTQAAPSATDPELERKIIELYR